MDPKTAYYSPSNRKADQNDEVLMAALEAAHPAGKTAKELGDLLGYSAPSRVWKPLQDLNFRLIHKRSPWRVRRDKSRRRAGVVDQVVYTLEPAPVYRKP